VTDGVEEQGERHGGCGEGVVGEMRGSRSREKETVLFHL